MTDPYNPGAGRGGYLRAVARRDQNAPVKSSESEGLFVRSRSEGAERARVERFIEQGYRDRFGSRIADHYPSILSLEHARGAVLAAVGIRNAGDETLFLERYFNEPIERAISRITGDEPLRAQILEIGNLAAVGRSATARLIAAAAAHLEASHCQYAVVTATDELRKLLRSFGFVWHTLADARADRLADRGRSWGRYYERNPKILAGKIKQAPDRMRYHARGSKLEPV